MSTVESHYLKVSEVAARLSLEESTVYKMVRQKRLPSIRIGEKAVRIPAGALEAYLRRAENEGRPNPVVLRDGETSSGSRSLADAVEAFQRQTKLDPHSFVSAWKKGSIADSAENASLAIEALALRAALDSQAEAERPASRSRKAATRSRRGTRARSASP